MKTKRRCTACGEPGHYRNSCPARDTAPAAAPVARTVPFVLSLEVSPTMTLDKIIELGELVAARPGVRKAAIRIGGATKRKAAGQ